LSSASRRSANRTTVYRCLRCDAPSPTNTPCAGCAPFWEGVEAGLAAAQRAIANNWPIPTLASDDACRAIAKGKPI
jgi:hypothetical protein